MIPKIIWQTHNYQYDDLPDHFLKATKSWRYLNPTWEYRYVPSDERDLFVKQELPDIYQVYKKSPPVFQSDLWRYLVVYKYGGVYADMDSVCIKPLDYMLKDYNGESLIHLKPYEGESHQVGLINNSHFAAVKNCKTLKDILTFNELFNRYNGTKVNLSAITWISYAAIIDIQKQKSEIFFDAELHSHELKKYFFDFRIDYYGETIKYSEFLKEKIVLSNEDLEKALPPAKSSESEIDFLPPNNMAYVDNFNLVYISDINRGYLPG